MLLYMLAGYTLYKKKILDEAGSKELATMLVKLIIPAVIVNSFCSEYTPEKAQKIAVSALGAALLLCVSILIGALKELADKYGICILLVHHLRKQSSSDPYDQISGSTGIMGVADTTWLMHRQRMSKTATIRVIGRDMDEKIL